jgi:hypothetical protein
MFKTLNGVLKLLEGVLNFKKHFKTFVARINL